MKRLKKRGNVMQLTYALEDSPFEYSKSIFLAGPTPRNKEITSWREEALEILEKLNYDGVVFIPEPRDGNFTDNYDSQIEWETEMLNKSDCILFWIPRNLETLPGFTTNIEWGRWENSGKVVIGFPESAPKNRYIKSFLPKLGLNINNTLESSIKEALEIVGNGSFRQGSETDIPLYIWNTPMFQNWYKSQLEVGNELIKAKLNYVFKMPKAKKVFLWILHVEVYIKSEDRIKENEFVLARTDICSAVLFNKKDKLEDTEIVLVKEFRSPVRNSEGFVYELPGGSSIKQEENIQVIQDELKEETSLEIEKSRLNYVISRQLVATLSSHQCHLYSVELTNQEIEEIKKLKNKAFGLIEDSEQTYVEIFTLKEILDNNLVDWSNLGMIFSVIC